MSFITPETFFIALSLTICAVIYVLRGRKRAPHGDLTENRKIDIVPGGEAAFVGRLRVASECRGGVTYLPHVRRVDACAVSVSHSLSIRT